MGTYITFIQFKNMNLQENIRKVLREEKRFSPFISRRLPEDEINTYFNGVKNRLMGMITSDKSSMMDKDEFKQFIITYTINFIMENYYDTFPEMTDFYEKLFDDLYEYYNNEMDESYESINNMNLQESIKRVLREEYNIPSYIRRRLGILQEYMDDLDTNDICKYWDYDEVDGFTNEALSEIVRIIVNSIPEIQSEDWYDAYDEVLGVLTDLNYHLEINDFFIHTLDNCDNYINESIDRNERIN